MLFYFYCLKPGQFPSNLTSGRRKGENSEGKKKEISLPKKASLSK